MWLQVPINLSPGEPRVERINLYMLVVPSPVDHATSEACANYQNLDKAFVRRVPAKMFNVIASLFKTRRVKCPDGTERLVHRDIDSAFPLLGRVDKPDPLSDRSDLNKA